MEVEFKSKENEFFIFRELSSSDRLRLSNFFEQLSNDTKLKYEPHALTKEQASIICDSIDNDNTKRFVIEKNSEIIGYFILDFNLFESENQRYRNYGVIINPKLDPVFAPCISDTYQNKGIASKAMKFILDYANKINLRSIILLGGTQELNNLAISFYKKFGFKEYGKFYTPHNDLNNIDMKLDL